MTGRSSEDQNTDGNEDIKGYVDEVSDEYEDSIGKWNRDCACYILANNLSTFCPCPETLGEDEFKGDRLIWQRKFQGGITFMQQRGYYWLLLAKFIMRIGSKIRLKV